MDDEKRPKLGGWYAHYALFVLVIVYVFNFIDRNILSILSQDIQADLGTTDAQMGFLYGTVFAVFYAVFGIPLARFADVWVRRSLISIGLLFWSLMTALSGFARSFSVLALFRVGVGIGEASASPAAYSMLSDYYPTRIRATVIAIYSSGVYIGGGIGLFLGGFIMETWDAAYPVVAQAPLELKGWHVAFLAVGIPGILMAAWVRTLREPRRGISEGLIADEHPAPLRVLREEFFSMIPPFNIVSLHRAGASLRLNAIAAMIIMLVAWALIEDRQHCTVDRAGRRHLCDVFMGPRCCRSRSGNVRHDLQVAGHDLHDDRLPNDFLRDLRHRFLDVAVSVARA